MALATHIDRVRQPRNVLFAIGRIDATFVPPPAGYTQPLGEGEPGVVVNRYIPA